MPSKLSILSYTAIVDFTIFYLLLLGTICLIYRQHTEETKGVCIVKNYTNVSTQAFYETSSPSTKPATTSVGISTLQQNALTETLDTLAQVTIKIFSKVGGPCSADSNCDGSAVFGTSQNVTAIFQATYCNGTICECNSAEFYIALVDANAPYRCARDQHQICDDDVQCFSNCNAQNKCVGNAAKVK